MLFDNSVRPEQDRLRNRQVERFRGFEIDHEFKFRRLLNGNIGWLRSFENLVDEHSGAPETLSFIGCIGHEPSCIYMITYFVHRRQLVLYGEVRNLLSVKRSKGVPNG